MQMVLSPSSSIGTSTPPKEGSSKVRVLFEPHPHQRSLYERGSDRVKPTCTWARKVDPAPRDEPSVPSRVLPRGQLAGFSTLWALGALIALCSRCRGVGWGVLSGEGEQRRERIGLQLLLR